VPARRRSPRSSRATARVAPARPRALFAFIFLVIFSAIFQSKTIYEGRGRFISYDTFFVPGILAYGVIATTFLNMAIGTAVLRDDGVLKRMAALPCPAGPTWPLASSRR